MNILTICSERARSQSILEGKREGLEVLYIVCIKLAKLAWKIAGSTTEIIKCLLYKWHVCNTKEQIHKFRYHKILRRKGR